MPPKTLFEKLTGYLVREKTSLPTDSTNAWTFWMASESLPTLVAAFELGIFEKLDSSSATESALRQELGLSPRAVKVLLWHLESLEFLAFNPETKKYSLKEVSRQYLLKRSADRKWITRLRQMIKNPVTPEGYLDDATGNKSVTLRFHHSEKSKSSDAALLKISRDRFALPAIITADRTGLIALLSERRVDAATIVETLELPLRYVTEMLSLLQTFGMASLRQQKWELTLAGHTYLLMDENHPYNWGGLFALMEQNPSMPKSLLEAIQKEIKSQTEAQGDPMMEHVMSPSLAQVFAKHMHSQGAAAAVAVAKHPIFKECRSVLDVAGGGGTYSLQLAKQNSRLKVSVMELSPMVDITKNWIRMNRVGSQVDTITGDMFHLGDWPKQKFDTVFFSHVFHDWDVPKIKFLLRNAFTALPPGGRIILHEVLVGHAGRRRDIATAFSVTLYKWTEGRQYKAVELMDLLRSIGFTVSVENIHAAHGPSSLIIGHKPTFKITI